MNKLSSYPIWKLQFNNIVSFLVCFVFRMLLVVFFSYGYYNEGKKRSIFTNRKFKLIIDCGMTKTWWKNCVCVSDYRKKRHYWIEIEQQQCKRKSELTYTRWYTRTVIYSLKCKWRLCHYVNVYIKKSLLMCRIWTR